MDRRKVRILQIFLDTDMRPGEFLLADKLKEFGIDRSEFKNGEGVIFLNRRRNILRLMGKVGLYSHKLPGNQTWDFNLRRQEIFDAAGSAFWIQCEVSERVYNTTKKDLKKEKEAA